MKPPTERDWISSDPDDLDVAYARKQFLGKSHDEAVAMFRRNALHYGEDLLWMPSVPLNYYALAFAEYVTSKEAAGDSDGASSFLSRLIWLLRHSPALLSISTRETMVEAARKVAKSQHLYDADIDIYGRFPDLLDEIETLLKKSGA